MKSQSFLKYLGSAKKRAYRNVIIGEQVGYTSSLRDIGLVDGKPALHVHKSLGHSDGSVRGGHLLSVMASPMPNVLPRRTSDRFTSSRIGDDVQAFKLNT